MVKQKILVVEDEQIVAMDLQRSLSDLGYSVVGIVDTGEDAVRSAAASRPDLVLMDVKLPGALDGIEAAKEIRRRWQIPVVFVSAYGNDETLSRAGSTAPYGYLLKPFRTRELNATILVALQQHRLARQMFAEHTWLRTLLGSLSDGVIATDEDGRVRYLNSSAEALTGWTLAEAAGRPIEEVYPLTDMHGERAEQCLLRKALATAKALSKARFLLHTKDGCVIAIEDSAAPIVEGGNPLGAVAVFVDIGERVRREQDQMVARERLEEQVHATNEALGHTRAEMRALSAHLMTAQEEERRRVARELHDDLGQRTALLEMDLTRLQSHLASAPGAVQDELRAVTAKVAQLSDALRTVSHRLYPPVLIELGIEAGIKALVDEHREHGMDVSLNVRALPSDIPRDVALSLYRITQEALRNAWKHAPGAPVQVRVTAEGAELQLSIEDAGPGFNLRKVRAKGGLGLLSMQERSRLAGGSLELRTGSRSGTSVVVRVPLATQARLNL